MPQLLAALLPSKQWLKSTFWLQHFLSFASPPKPVFLFQSTSSGFRFNSYAANRRLSTIPVRLDQPEDGSSDLDKLRVLRQKIEVSGITLDDSCVPGRYHHLICPKCNGGQLMERSLSLHITQDRNFAMWRCFRSTCGWAGRVFPESSAAYSEVTNNWMTVDSLGLEPLGDKLIAYFGERMISEKTLWRNAVMQLSGNQSGQLIIMSVIALTYRQNGRLVGCKYRSMGKRFWQEKGTEKILYGLDDIQEANEIIIVEGEVDKLSVEEAGFCNCVSVPGGAPQKVSAKELPSLDKGKEGFYLNCFIRSYLITKDA
ncbi:twinkle homolog protein, chloroplastic/mitochondrial isoform X3 [Vitis vinifera]|uniref:twinkle homolog protein, chloroplastic/mitochondrial isoform X3 n=1 Tax=Vitis vinifera TaxID=29760 RepID=UPI00053FF1D8|nr:twinkle homolog protein, chloroplastic/mitochondrial isoform X3 [Vitis vinifera]|eukprot:XP_010655845.1 PREDICTED: twinkle homolog protein, chloroplastic/mitochondrial isoform X3 [Vitis vinifera]